MPALRQWLTRKQRETVRGRAELRLAERAALWTARPENRHLPAWWEWANIRLFTRSQEWTAGQRKMMRQARRYHGWRGLALAALLAVATVAAVETRRQVVEHNRAIRAADLVQRLVDANLAQVPGIVTDIEAYRAWADPLLREAHDQAADGSRQQLHTSLALLPVDAGQVELLYRRLLAAEPHEVPVLRDALLPHQHDLRDKLWTAVEQPPKGQEPQRLRAAAALARYDPDSPRWAKVQDQVANDLVGVQAVYLAGWLEAFRPVRSHLLEPLAVVFRDAKRRETERSLATDLLADYAADQPAVLIELLKDADTQQYAKLWPKLLPHREQALAPLRQELTKTLKPQWQDSPLDPAWGAPDAALAVVSETAKDALALRQAQAAVALLQLGQDEQVWPLFRHSPDPRVRTFLIHRLSPLGTDPRSLLRRLQEEHDVSIRRALLLCLGEFGEDRLPVPQRQTLVPALLGTYRDDPDPGIHGATEWLLRCWGHATDLARIDKELVSRQAREKRRWYVNSEGQTLVVIPGPVEFEMGSPAQEPGRIAIDEPLHRKRISRTFAIASKEVTVEQFLRFRASHRYLNQYSPEPEGPITCVTWYDAANYCNWLSEQEGIPESEWCYPKNVREGMRLPQAYLGKRGYRLPTEAEWEYACRAGAVTTRSYGVQDDRMLAQYARFLANAQNHTWPVGLLKPNDLGLFDMYGNVYEWCQERAMGYRLPAQNQANEDKEDIIDIIDKEHRLIRGGAFTYAASDVRSAYRYSSQPSYVDIGAGLRPARTYP